MKKVLITQCVHTKARKKNTNFYLILKDKLEVLNGRGEWIDRQHGNCPRTHTTPCGKTTSNDALLRRCSLKSMNDTDIEISSYDETNLVEHPKQPKIIRKSVRGMVNQRNWVPRTRESPIKTIESLSATNGTTANTACPRTSSFEYSEVEAELDESGA